MTGDVVDELRQRQIDTARLVVVKIGSAVLSEGGRLSKAMVNQLGGDIALLRRTGRDVIVVSSGAIASGLGPLGLKSMPQAIADKQAAAAVGQQVLMQAWAEALRRSRTTVAQVLLTADDLDHRTRYLNARHTLQSLLARGVLPIVNENDSVSFDEIKMGDNDHLSALVTTLVAGQLLIMLTNVDGLRQGGARGAVMRQVPADADVSAHVEQARSVTGVGGMGTKVAAARLVGDAGIPAIIAPGRQKGVLRDIVAGKAIGTYFEPKASVLDLRRRWLATATRARGSLIVDAGARRALVEQKASLLPSGILRVEGRFPAGAVVRICDEAGAAFARGLAAYASDEIEKVRGCKGADLPAILGYRYLDEIVHRNDMVVEKQGLRD